MGKSARLVKKLQEAIKEEYGLRASINIGFHAEYYNPNNFKKANNVINDFAEKLNLEKTLSGVDNLIFVSANRYTDIESLQVSYYLQKEGIIR